MAWQRKFDSAAPKEPRFDTSWFRLLEFCKQTYLHGKNSKPGGFGR